MLMGHHAPCLAKAIPMDACEEVIGCSNEDMGGSGGCFILDELDEGGLNENAELFVTGVVVVVVAKGLL